MTTKRAKKRAIKHYIREGIARETARRTERGNDFLRAADDIASSREGIINATRKLGYASTALQSIQDNMTAKQYSRKLRQYQQALLKMDKQLENMLVTVNAMGKKGR